MAQRKLIIAGGSGFLGQSFAQHLLDSEHGDWEIVILSRSKPQIADARNSISHAQWDGRSLGSWVEQLRGCTHILNLAGRSVDCRKTPGRCDEILRSRVESTRVLGQALRSLDLTPEVWVQMSTAHIYGDPPTTVCDEDSPFGYGLAPTVGKAWEAEYESVCPGSTRSVVLRTSFVLGRFGGAFPTLKRVAALGLGGKMGTGTQGISWLHIDDMNRIFEDAMLNDQRRGVYIATAPEPVSYMEFMRALRKRLGMPVGLPGSAIGLKMLCATLLDSDPELVLSGRYCVPKRLMDESFSFTYHTLEEALMELVPK